jgi:anti-sigma factor RsiW
MTAELTCAEFVDLVTDYLEDALDPADRRRFEQHAGLCPGCDTYLDQIRVTIAETGRLTPERLEPEARDRLLEAFRGWAAGPAGSGGEV